MTNILVLYPGTQTFRQAQVAQHRPVIEALGIRLVLADDAVDASDMEHFADAIELPPPEHVGEALSRVRRWLASHEAHGVLGQSESSLLLGSLVARDVGVPCISPGAALLTTSKHLCRVALEDARVPQPRFALCTCVSDVRRFAHDHGYPVVLKGVASALSRLVTLVRDDAAVDDAVARLRAGLSTSVDIGRLVDFGAAARIDLGCDPREQFLVESFAGGAPVETDGVVAGSDIRTFGVVEQVLTPPPLFHFEGYLLPSDRPGSDEVERVSDAALRALGVTDTGFSNEMRLDGGAASVIEVNGRLGWDEGFGELFETVIGAQPALLALQVALGRSPVLARRPGVRAAVAYACCYADRVVERAPGAGEIARVEREHGVRCALAVRAGERMFAPPHPDISPHLAYALASDATSSQAAYARARAAVDELSFELLQPLTSEPLRAGS